MKRTLFGLVVLVGTTAPGQQTAVLWKHLSSWDGDLDPLNNGTAPVCGGTFPTTRGSKAGICLPRYSSPGIEFCQRDSRAAISWGEGGGSSIRSPVHYAW